MSEELGYTKNPSLDEKMHTEFKPVEDDYSYVNSTARIAVYDDLRSAPRVVEIKPAKTNDFIESLASTIYDLAKKSGGHIPYTVIREVSENFIHARFTEIVVSVLDGGETIRFADQGPGIAQKEKAQLPGFTSATEPMKGYIRGVGSGLPIVNDYLSLSHGTITIEDNLTTGSVVTISLVVQPEAKKTPANHAAVHVPMPVISQRGKDFLKYFLSEGAMGVTDLVNLSGVAQSSTHSELKKLEEAGLVEKTASRKRILTDLGYQVATSL